MCETGVRVLSAAAQARGGGEAGVSCTLRPASSISLRAVRRAAAHVESARGVPRLPSAAAALCDALAAHFASSAPLWCRAAPRWDCQAGRCLCVYLVPAPAHAAARGSAMLQPRAPMLRAPHLPAHGSCYRPALKPAPLSRGIGRAAMAHVPAPTRIFLSHGCPPAVRYLSYRAPAPRMLPHRPPSLQAALRKRDEEPAGRHRHTKGRKGESAAAAGSRRRARPDRREQPRLPPNTRSIDAALLSAQRLVPCDGDRRRLVSCATSLESRGDR
jgi:hypothetical protein